MQNKQLDELLSSKYGIELVREGIAKIFHDAWEDWSKTIAKEENISEKRIKRWQTFWDIDYCYIQEKDRKEDYEYADRVLVRLGITMYNRSSTQSKFPGSNYDL